MSNAAERIEAAADHVADVAAAVVETEALDSAALVERLEERAEAAEELAEDLAAAQLMTNLGRDLAAVTEGLNECRSNLSQLESAMTEKLEAINQQLAALATPQPATLLIPQPSPETPIAEADKLATETTETLQAVVTNPQAVAESVAAPAVQVLPVKRSRWI